MLEGIQIDITGSQGLIRSHVVGEGLDIHLESLFFCFLGHKFHNLFRITRCNAYGDFLLFRRRLGVLLVTAAAGNGAGHCQGCQRKG